MTNLIEELNKKAIKDDYLSELTEKIQINYSKQLFEMPYDKLTKKEFNDILRFTDILSRSEKSQNSNLATKIISTLFDEYKHNNTYQLFAQNTMIKSGNFPALKLIADISSNIENEEIELDKISKKIFQKTPTSKSYFTDVQYDIFLSLKKSNHYSFSAGTSFGKSFLFSEYVNWLIKEKNGSENIAFLVPTRALISQVVNDLKCVIINDNYRIVSNPDIPAIFRDKKCIFVFTPERLINYFSNSNNPNISTMIVDEAHNIVSHDERSPMFYHAITLANQKSINLYFAAPNIENPEIFLKLAGNSQEESRKIHNVNVVQNRFFFDFVEKRAHMYFNHLTTKTSEELEFNFTDFNNLLQSVTKTDQAIIYCNSISEIMKRTVSFSKKLKLNNNNELAKLSEHISKTIHEEYYLAKLVKYGIGFHFGALPVEIREKIEEQFKKGNIKYLFTTSTLLQGVNLPAKHLFIISDKIGQSHLKELDFKNLAGRAGRLAQELSGNVFVIRLKKDSWKNKTKELIGKNKPTEIKSIVLSDKANFYKNIENSINNKEMTNKSMSQIDRKIISEYATIFAFQQKQDTPSQLIDNFVKKNHDHQKSVIKVLDMHVPKDILMLSTTINIKYQETIIQQEQWFELDAIYDYDFCLKILQMLSSEYNWNKEEDKRRLGNYNRLPYYAVLMSQWINSKPFKTMIKSAIKYKTHNESKISISGNPTQTEIFSHENAAHVNHVINELFNDIEHILCFKVKNYINNYILLSKQNDCEWQNYLEFGTDNKLAIELQKIGLERQTSLELAIKYPEMFTINEKNEIVEINTRELLNANITKQAKDKIKLLLEN